MSYVYPRFSFVDLDIIALGSGCLLAPVGSMVLWLFCIIDGQGLVSFANVGGHMDGVVVDIGVQID